MSELSEIPKEGEPPPSRRPRAPTITIDTAVNSSPSSEMATEPQGRPSDASAPAQDDGNTTPTTTADPLAASWSSSQRTATAHASSRPDLQASTSFDSRDSRPTSPHNVSSPVTSRGNDKGTPTFLSVPSNLRSRQNSIDSEDAPRSVVSSQGETAVAASSSQSGDSRQRSSGDASNEKIKNDETALKPDQGREAEFKVENNPFAFTPGQLNKMFNPKSLPAFYKMGGLRGLEKGLRSDRKAGLSVDEHGLDGSVSFEEATRTSDKLAMEGVSGDFKESGRRASTAASRTSGESFSDRKRVFSDNRLPEKKGKSLLQLMWITFNDKVLILLSIAAAISLAVGLYQTFAGEHEAGQPKVEWVEGVAIIGAIAVVVIVGSLNDYQKERQFAKLNKKKQDRLVRVVRSGQVQEISVYDILVGDLVRLEPGDLVPVDGVLVEGFNVKCDESQTTGESDVIRKTAAEDVYQAIENNESLRKMDPFIQSGSKIMEGVGTFMCTSTGIHSSYGRTLVSLNDDPEITPLQSKLNVIAEYIAKVGGAAALLLFIVLFIMFLARLPKSEKTPAGKGREFLEIFIVVVTIIVVAVPEGLPLAVTLALSFATTRMLRDNNLVRHLKACEVMGNATTICSDKTGTLTQNRMLVVAGTIGTSHRFGGGGPPTAPADDDEGSMHEEEEDTSADISPQELVSTLRPEVKELLKHSIVLNSTAFEGEVEGVKQFIGSKTETAMLIFAKDHLSMGAVSEERENSKTLQLIPFDSGRKCMGIVVSLENGKARLYVKGASEIVLAKCTQMLRDPSADLSLVAMTEEHQGTISKLINRYASRSLRTIAIAYRDFERWPPRAARRAEGGEKEIAFEDLFHSMAFVGMVGIQDPLRDGVPEAVRICQKAGVVIRMVTGDNKVTAQAIAQECGILRADSVIMEGPEFRNLTKAEQEQIIPRLHVLARSSPEDKRILVKRLKDKGEIVAVTGDGTNDAPALRMADVGFSMGITGTEVAKEASAIILMDDNFNSIVKALKWGRAVNDAVKRFLQFQLTVNVTAVVTTFVTAVSTEGDSVFTAVQLLWVNLIMDTLAALALATDPPRDSVLNRKPEPRRASIISTTMWKMIIGQALYQLAITFLLFYGKEKVLNGLVPDDIPITKELVATLVFNTFVWMQIFNQWNNRRLDNEFNIFEGITKNWIFIAISLVMCGAQVAIVFVGGVVFDINSPPEGKKDPQGPVLWAVAIVLGLLSIPIGMVIRLVPDPLVKRLVPDFLMRRTHGNVPGLTISDEEAHDFYPSPLTDVRDELAFLKRVKGGRLTNLKFAMRHPRETFKQRSRSPSHSRSNSIKTPQTPTREDSFGSAAGAPAAAATPESRKRSKSMRSRSNSALGAPTVMAGIIAAGVAANWSPIDRTLDREDSRLTSGGSGVADGSTRETTQTGSESQRTE